MPKHIHIYTRWCGARCTRTARRGEKERERKRNVNNACVFDAPDAWWTLRFAALTLTICTGVTRRRMHLICIRGHRCLRFFFYYTFYTLSIIYVR